MAAFVTDNATKLSAAIFMLIVLIFIGWELSSAGVELVVAIGVIALYQGSVDLLRIFYVLSAVLAAVHVIQLARSEYKGWVVLLAIIRVLTEGASVWFGYQVRTVHFLAMNNVSHSGCSRNTHLNL